MTADGYLRLTRPELCEADRVFQAECSWGREYGVYLVDDLLANEKLFASILAGRKVVVVTTPTVWSLYGERLEALGATMSLDMSVLVLPVNEATKSMETVLRICERCVEHRLGRTDAILALGGGVCHDLVTVAASLVRRGVSYVCVPTTLVAQIDAGIGIKGAVNFMGSKSYLGTFRPPDVVLVDPAFLATAPDVTLSDGVAEALKVALIGDPRLFDILEEQGASLLQSRFSIASDTAEEPALEPAHVREVLQRSITAMLRELSTNFFEDQTYRRKVDFGHTFSGTIEDISSYSVSHGQAVSMDMALSASIALTLERLTREDFDRIVSTMGSLGLPTYSPMLNPELCAKALHSASLHRGGVPNLVIPHGIGSCGFVADMAELATPTLQAAIRRLERT